MNDPLERLLEQKTGGLETVEPQTSVMDAVARMNQRSIGSVLVMEGERLVGIFTERDVLTRVVPAPAGPEQDAGQRGDDPPAGDGVAVDDGAGGDDGVSPTPGTGTCRWSRAAGWWPWSPPAISPAGWSAISSAPSTAWSTTSAAASGAGHRQLLLLRDVAEAVGPDRPPVGAGGRRSAPRHRTPAGRTGRRSRPPAPSRSSSSPRPSSFQRTGVPAGAGDGDDVRAEPVPGRDGALAGQRPLQRQHRHRAGVVERVGVVERGVLPARGEALAEVARARDGPGGHAARALQHALGDGLQQRRACAAWATGTTAGDRRARRWPPGRTAARRRRRGSAAST